MRLARIAGRALAGALVLALAAAPEARGQGMDPDAERMRQLVLRIRRSMREIDSMLLQGSQPERTERELAANLKRIEELLNETESKSKAVVDNLEQLIQEAKYQQSGQGGGGGEPPPDPQGGDPKGGRQPKRQKSQDPQELAPQPQDGEQPQPEPKDGQEPGGEKPEGQKPEPKPKDGDPKGGGPDPSDPEQRNANRPPPSSPTAEFERRDATGRWGVLPPKEAEDLQRRNAEEFPQRYRAWMEAYFRRVTRLPARDR